MSRNGILAKNEQETNKLCAKIMIVSIVFLIVVYIMQVVGIFKSDLIQVGIAFSISIVLLLIPIVMVLGFKAEGAWLKYLIVTVAALVVSIINIFLSKDVVVLWLYAITLSSLYFSKKLSWYSLVVSMITLTASQIFTTEAGILEDYNYKDDWFIPVLSRNIEVAALAFIYVILSKRTSSMLSNVVGSEEQKSILDKLMALISKSTEVSDVLINSVESLSTMTEETTRLNEKITDKTNDVTAGSEDAIRYIAQATRTVSDISANLSNTAQDSKLISGMALKLNEMTENSGVIIHEAVQEMKIIEKTTIESKDTINKLGERSNEIGKIVEVIKQISAQTNLLALNAAIEAARSGEYGKGFAVVADEVRKLAEQSEAATKEISELINQVLADTGKAVEEMDRNAALVDKGMLVINKAGESFEKVTETNHLVNEKLQTITKAAQEAAEYGVKLVELVENVENINTRNLDELKSIAAASQTQLSSMQEVAASVDNIEKISVELTEVIKEMK
ncbi:MAG: methyl-accepting chemotaxis protein [Bacillota bacterium]